MEKYNREEKLLGEMMQHSSMEMPFNDFEEKLMARIDLEKNEQKPVLSTIRIAWLFFCLGLFFGLLITNLTTNLDQLIAGVPAKKIALFVQVGVVLILLLQFDKLISFTFKKKD